MIGQTSIKDLCLARLAQVRQVLRLYWKKRRKNNRKAYLIESLKDLNNNNNRHNQEMIKEISLSEVVDLEEDKVIGKILDFREAAGLVD